MSRADDPRITTTDGDFPTVEDGPAPKPIDPDTGQYKAYWVLSEHERAKGFVRPVRYRYLHTKCGGITIMGKALSETYAVNPKFYGGTFCCKCRAHFPVGEFTWTDDGTVVGS